MRGTERTPIDDDAENAEIKPAGGRRVRQRPLECPARRLNDVYRAYTERKATQQDTQTALS